MRVTWRIKHDREYENCNCYPSPLQGKYDWQRNIFYLFQTSIKIIYLIDSLRPQLIQLKYEFIFCEDASAVFIFSILNLNLSVQVLGSDFKPHLSILINNEEKHLGTQLRVEESSDISTTVIQLFPIWRHVSEGGVGWYWREHHSPSTELYVIQWTYPCEKKI
jgi:hypothetical protein